MIINKSQRQIMKKIMLTLTLVGFAFLHKLTAQNNITEHNDSIEIIFGVDAWPDFNKESTKGLIKFIDKNVREVNIPEGNSRVFVQFIVDTLGYTSNHKIIKGVNPELDNEALRISRLLKFMKPAIQRGKPINFIYTLPFDFKKLLLDKKEAREDKKHHNPKEE